MEENKIKAFLAINFGDGSGNGSGYGTGTGSGYCTGDGDVSGDGDGSGYGTGSGDGSGYGDGDGDGDGYGYGKGLEELDGEKIYRIDDVPTVLRSIHGNVAKGAIVNSDLTLTPCFVVKQDDLFAHGETLRAAMDALRDKLFEKMPEDERIDAFVSEHQAGIPYPNRDLYDWHHRLTGSCDMGRRTFVSEHGIDMDGETTVEEFICLTENAYGGAVIKKLKERYGYGGARMTKGLGL